MKRILLAVAAATCLTGCFIEGDSSKNDRIEVLEQELDSMKRNPTVVRDTIEVREELRTSSELTDEAKALLNEITE